MTTRKPKPRAPRSSSEDPLRPVRIALKHYGYSRAFPPVMRRPNKDKKGKDKRGRSASSRMEIAQIVLYLRPIRE